MFRTRHFFMHVIYERRKNVMWLNNNNKNPQSLDQTYSFILYILLICTSVFLYSVNFSSHSLWRHPIIQPKGINSWNNTCSSVVVTLKVEQKWQKKRRLSVCVLTFDDNTIYEWMNYYKAQIYWQRNHINENIFFHRTCQLQQ